jgi:hypothetical protein
MKVVQYPDKWLCIAGIPIMAILIRHFGAAEPIDELLITKQYYLDIAFNMLFALLIWQTSKYIIVMLDKRYSWPNHRFERFIIQFALVLGVSFLEVVGLVYLYNEVLPVRLQSFITGWQLIPFLPLAFVFVILINLIYTGWYLIQYHHRVVDRLTQERDEAFQAAEQLKLDLFYNENNDPKFNLYQEHLIVNLGYASIPILVADIAYIFRMADTCFLKTFDGKEYTSHSSLESLETLIDPAIFFRINSQMLAHVRSIKKIKPDNYGKLGLDFTPPFEHEVFVSKRKVTQFKQWLGKKI